jgi:4-amino-4-deoxy-L-arabinose transferase-like glycosyltransferase
MPKNRKRKKSAGGRKKDPAAFPYPVVVPVILTLALMLPHIGDAYGGFHGGGNEGFYAQLGVKVAENPLKYPVKADGTIDYNIPPLTGYLLGADFMLFGASEASARTLMTLFSAASAVLIFLIGRRLLGEKAGLTASAIFAVTPMEVLVGRNVQTDPVFMALGLLSLHLYLEGRMIASGAALGLGFLAKQPVVLFLAGMAALDLLEKRPLKRLLPLAAAAAIVSSPYVIFNLAQNAGGFLGGQTSRLMLPVSEEGGRHGLDMVAFETFWGLSPLIAASFALGVAHMAYARRREDTPILVYVVIFLGFFVFYNKHSYYILPLAPFAALSSARLLAKAGPFAAALTVLLVLSGAFYSVLMMCGNKYGYEEFKRVPTLYRDDEKPVILITEIIAGNYIDSLRYYNPGAEIVDLSALGAKRGEIIPLDYGRPTYNLIHRAQINLKRLPEAQRRELLAHSAAADKYALVIFGAVFYEAPINPHFFSNTPIQISGGLPWYSFGVMKLDEVPELYLVKLKPGERMQLNADGSYTMKAAAG